MTESEKLQYNKTLLKNISPEVEEIGIQFSGMIKAHIERADYINEIVNKNFWNLID